MDETRALLDALMGPNRNSRETTKKGRVPDFADKSVCKHFLVGFCPHDWFTTAKRQLKPCSKIHSEMMREQFEAHRDSSRYRAEYEEDFLAYLEVVARDCDAYIARERPKCRPRGSGGKVARLPPDVKKRCEEMESRYAELIKDSEKLADTSLAQSQAHMKQAIALKEELDDTKQKYTSEFPGEDLCDICGVKYLCGGGGMQWHDEEDHKRGKTHDGFRQIREKITELRGKRKKWEKYREDVEKSRADERDREREREKGRERERAKEREREKERDRERERERKERERELEVQREKEKEREREREKEREREREKEQERARRKEKEKDRQRASQKDRGRAARSGSRSRSRSRQKGDQQDPEPDLPSLWARLGQLTPEGRAEAVKALPPAIKDRLESWLVARIKAQGGPGADSDSDSS